MAPDARELSFWGAWKDRGKLLTSFECPGKIGADRLACKMRVDAGVAFLFPLSLDLVQTRELPRELEGPLNDTHPGLHADHYLTAVD